MAGTEIVGHRQQTESLLEDLRTGNVAHAYLFVGKRHVGKFTVARWFAKTLLLVDAKDDEARHRTEHAVDRLLHPDLFVLDKLWIEDQQEDLDELSRFTNLPQQHRAKAHARTDTISIDDVRVLQERLHDVRAGTYRCCVIRSMERMQAEAVNALLKILEEPPPGVVFILTADAVESLLPTLVSRSRVIHFSPLPHAELAPLLKKQTQEDVQFILRVAQGAPGTVLRLRDDSDALRKERQLYANATAFWHAPTLSERLQSLDALSDRNPEAERMLFHLALSLRSEPADVVPDLSAALHVLLHDLETNVSRPLAIQRFALSTGPL